MLDRGAARFSLLLLADGERYVQDHACSHHVDNGKPARGRLRVCTHSIFFEPELRSLPILRVPFNRMQQVGERGGKCLVLANETTEMKKSGRDYPYVFVAHPVTHVFSLDHSTNDDLLLCIAELFRCSKDGSSPDHIVSRYRDGALPFKLSNLVDWNEEILADCICNRIKPFILEECRLVLTTKRLYLQPVDDIEGSTQVFELKKVRQVFRRRHALREIGLEILMPKKAVFVAFESMSERDQIYTVLFHHPVVDVALDKESSDAVMAKWVRGDMSNYDYLMYINNLAGRTKNDMAQYPVFPWILTDYTSSSIDLSDASIYRDLSKPVGALNPQRLATFKERLAEMPADGQEFLYGTHYSTPGYVLFYLVRKRPELMLRLQNGKFDAPDRSFYSIPQTWQSCYQSSTDLKELIPEFFSDPSILENAQNLELGERQNGARVDDVELPPWCRPNDFKQFMETHREALESQHVSANLHQWIDLIFGSKQRGAEAKQADNLFYPLTYQGSIDVESVEDEQMRASYELQISEFGQTPKQVFFKPHPQRFSSGSNTLESAAHIKPASASAERATLHVEGGGGGKDIRVSVEESSLIELLGGSEVVVVNQPLDGAFGRMRQCVNEMQKHERLHREPVTGLCGNAERLVSVSKDQFVKVHVRDEAHTLKQTRSCNVSGFPLSCCQMLSDDIVLVGSWDSKVHLYSIAFNRSLESFLAHDDSVSAMRFVGNRLCTGGLDTLVRLWAVREDSVEKVPVCEVYDLDGEVSSVDLGPPGMFLAASTHGVVLVGDERIPGHVVKVVQADSNVYAVRWLGDGMRAVVGHQLLDVGTGALIPLTEQNAEVSTVRAVESRGAMALLASDTGVRLWDVTARSEMALSSETEPSLLSDVRAMHVADAAGYFGTEDGSVWFY